MIARLEIGRHGEIYLLTRNGKLSQWYDMRQVPPRLLDPFDDDRIPLSARINKEGADRYRVVNYRPGRRLVVIRKGGAANSVIKGFRHKKFPSMAEKYRFASEALERGPVRAVRILETDAADACLRLHREEGKRSAIDARDSERFRELGAGLHLLQCAEDSNGLLEVFRRQDELGVLDERLRRLRLATGDAPRNWSTLRNALGAAAGAAPSAPAVPCHRDLHDGQWLISQDKPCLLDFDLLCKAEPELDVANFLAHLRLRAMQHPRKISGDDAHACRDAFLEGHGAGYSRARLAFYEATTFARLALVYLLRPRWQHLADNLVEQGLERLNATAGGDK